ncbi:hypothetical protein BH24ACI2_BH24ACI2_02100 [soil metagenome]|jgi:hypothetical protein|nr:hypothetical protein [Acidobacteriota bacterium]
MTIHSAKDSLQGSVKELYARTVTLSEKNGDVLEEFPFVRLLRYDKAGNKIEEAHYNSDDSLLFKTVYAYDPTGKLVEQVNFDANESPTFKTVYEYDFDGKLIEQKSFGADGTLANTLCPVYTNEGLRIEEETLPLSEENGGSFCLVAIEGTDMSFSAQGGDRMRKVYDDKGKPIEMTLYNIKGKRTGKMLFAYDDERLIEVSNYGGSNGFYPCGERTKWQRILEPLTIRLIKIFLLLKCIYSFGIRGKLRKAARCILYGPLVISTIFVYDDKGQVVEEQTHFIGSVMMKRTFAYDEKGNKAEEIEYIDKDSVLQKQNYSREYDFQGNWVTETISCQFRMEEKREQSTVITNRTISYYSS